MGKKPSSKKLKETDTTGKESFKTLINIHRKIREYIMSMEQ